MVFDGSQAPTSLAIVHFLWRLLVDTKARIGRIQGCDPPNAGNNIRRNPSLGPALRPWLHVDVWVQRIANEI